MKFKPYIVDEKFFASKEAAVRAQHQIYQIQMQMLEAEQKADLDFRREIGLTLLENDAKILYDKVVQAAIEFSFAHEMDKSQELVDSARLKLDNTRTMYRTVTKKIFKLCLKHGVKSEHSS